MSKAPAQEEAVHAYGWATRNSSGILSPYHFTRRANGDNDITTKIQYCGICHGDIHLVKNKIWPTIYPTVPGEIPKIPIQVYSVYSPSQSFPCSILNQLPKIDPHY
ncbi:putative 8-hydroxygeraniol dehydrogenase [Rosa chinensis]|uniref:Putative 8-hydroxygeraniol dehydrogenase n=1 Tax=Rosa chinensis TaxID=74649 RepID=A0A2P6PQN8_ROSCH|nr:putative 8-hydroxygeraniol dehydrogenase [Rosa chinensis]